MSDLLTDNQEGVIRSLIREIAAEKSSIKQSLLVNSFRKQFKWSEAQVKKATKEELDALTILSPDNPDSIKFLVKDIWYDSQKNYYRKLSNEEWDPMNVDQARRHLRVACKLGDDKDSDQVTELDQALHHIETVNHLTGALPFPLNPNEIVTWNGKKFLNTATAQLMAAEPGGPVEWGEGFPWFAAFLDRLFPGVKNKEIVLAWLRVWYTRVIEQGSGGRGHALFIVGPQKTGKTFFSNRVLGNIFGGISDVSDFFVEGGQFNATIFDNVVWALDDSTLLGQPGANVKFSGLVKKAVANPSFPYDRKYGYKGSVPFDGRFICTLNDGPTSIKILPNTDQDLLDKVIFVRTGSLQARMCGSPKANEEKLLEELPHFLRWLVNSTHASWITTDDERCGIDSWHDEWVLGEAKSESDSANMIEIIDALRETNANTSGKDRGHWIGTPSGLYAMLKTNETTKHYMDGVKTPNRLGVLINACIAQGYRHVTRMDREGKDSKKLLRIDY